MWIHRSPKHGELTGLVRGAALATARLCLLSVFYSPFEGIGGSAGSGTDINDFGFNATGVPFVPFRRCSRSAPRPLVLSTRSARGEN